MRTIISRPIFQLCCISYIIISQAFVHPLNAKIFSTFQVSSVKCDLSMNYAVVGPAGGLCEVIAKQISDRGISSTVFFQELQGTSPVNNALNNCKIIQGDVSDKQNLEQTLKGSSVVIACGDCGLKREDTPTAYDPADLLCSVIEAAPASVETIVIVKPAEKEQAKGGLFGGRSPIQALEARTGCQKVVVTHGTLFGALPGNEPLPFLTGPKVVPVLDESFKKKGVLLSASDVLARDGQTLRSSLGEAILRLLDQPGQKIPKDQLSFSVISVEDTEEPSDEAWEKEFARLDNSKGVQVYSTEFGEVQNYASFVRWLSQKWGPNTLKNLGVVERARSGARPVNTLEIENGVAIVWETVDRDMNVVKAGKLEILINQANPSLIVSRTDGNGAPLTSVLPGEEEIVQNLIEGLNTVAYPRGFVVKVANVVSKEEMAPSQDAPKKETSSSSKKTRAARPGRRKTSVKRS